MRQEKPPFEVQLTNIQQRLQVTAQGSSFPRHLVSRVAAFLAGEDIVYASGRRERDGDVLTGALVIFTSRRVLTVDYSGISFGGDVRDFRQDQGQVRIKGLPRRNIKSVELQPTDQPRDTFRWQDRADDAWPSCSALTLHFDMNETITVQADCPGFADLATQLLRGDSES